MKFLLDTNVLIPLEPTSPENVEAGSQIATELVRLAGKAGSQLFVHEAQKQDFENDSNTPRRKLRELLLGKYSTIRSSDNLPKGFIAKVGNALLGTNDYVDDQILAAIYQNGADYLVTADLKIHRKALAVGLSNRVLTLANAVQLLGDLFDEPTAPPPAVESIESYQLDSEDPIWESFRQDYPGFDTWLNKVRLDHRPCWIIPGEGKYGAVCIVKNEDPPDYGLLGKQLKICSLKVASEASGLRFGELLLKTVFEFAYKNRYQWIVITTFEKQFSLVRLLKDFGFEELDSRSSLGELILAKPMIPGLDGRTLSGADLHTRYGPRAIDWSESAFVVPIQPTYHELLFPELRAQYSLPLGSNPCGNGIRKAYLSHSLNRKICRGSIIALYRSGDQQAVTTLGVIEEVHRLANSDAIATAVGNRTVYSFREIERFAKKQTLVILFRPALHLGSPLRLEELRDQRILKGPPQSITQISESAKLWLKNQLEM